MGLFRRKLDPISTAFNQVATRAGHTPDPDLLKLATNVLEGVVEGRWTGLAVAVTSSLNNDVATSFVGDQKYTLLGAVDLLQASMTGNIMKEDE